MTICIPITRTQVAISDRVDVAAALFGYDFPLQLEPFVFRIASEQAMNYGGGYWAFYRLSNGGFYMAPEGDALYRMVCPNHYQGELTGDALGIVACLTAYSHLSFSGDSNFARRCARHYHRLRAYAAEHPESEQIDGATD